MKLYGYMQIQYIMICVTYIHVQGSGSGDDIDDCYDDGIDYDGVCDDGGEDDIDDSDDDDIDDETMLSDWFPYLSKAHFLLSVLHGSKTHRIVSNIMHFNMFKLLLLKVSSEWYQLESTSNPTPFHSWEKVDKNAEFSFSF